MQETLFYIGILCALLAGGFFISSVMMFVKFRIPTLWRDSKGTLERGQIEEIRSKNSDAAKNYGRVNVFEELEKKAKVKKNHTQSLNLGTTTSSRPLDPRAGDAGTVVLKNSAQTVNPNFTIQKNIMFVSTSEVI